MVVCKAQRAFFGTAEFLQTLLIPWINDIYVFPLFLNNDWSARIHCMMFV